MSRTIAGGTEEREPQMPAEFFGMAVVVDGSVPPDEIHIRHSSGRVDKIVNIGPLPR